MDPVWTVETMQLYCSWLHERLQQLRQDLGVQSLRQCRAEVDFSKNSLRDDAVRTLLEALVQSEMHVTILKLFANRISGIGMTSLCTFVERVRLFMWSLMATENAK